MWSDWCKGFGIIDSMNLGVAAGDQACLVAGEITVSVVFDPVDSLAGDDLATLRTRS